MPSGSKKRKSLKKPKPGEPASAQGDPPELELGLEESMAKDGEEMVEGSPSPKVMDEAMADFGVEEGKEPIAEASREEEEVAEIEEAPVLDHPEVSTRDLPSQTELEPEAPTITETEACDENDMEGGTPADITQGDPPQIEEAKDISLGESSQESEVPPGEIKPLIEPDAELTGLERDKDGAAAPPIDIAPEPDEGEATVAFRNVIGQEALVGGERGHDEPPLELEQIAAVAQEDTEPEDDTTPDDVSAVRVDPGADETPVAMDFVLDAALGDTLPENDEAMVVRELDTEAASANAEPEGTDVAPVEIAAETDDGPISVQSEVDEAVVGTQPETDAAAEILDMDPEVADDQPEMDEDPVVGEVRTPSPDSKPEATDSTPPDLAVEIEGPPDFQSEMNETAGQRQLETDAVPSNLESERAESELEKDAAEVVEDASIAEIDQEAESVVPGIESQPDTPEGGMEASTLVSAVGVEPLPEIIMREAESETEVSPGEIKPEVDARFDEPKRDEVAEAETKSEVNATLTDAEQVEEPLVVVTKLESDERASIELEPEVEEENTLMSLEAEKEIETKPEKESEREIEAEPEGESEKEIEAEPERPLDAPQEIEAVTGPATSEVEDPDVKVERESSEVGGSNVVNEGVETPIEADIEPKEVTIHEVELGDDTESANEALTEPSAVSGYKEELNDGVETLLEADTEPDGETTHAYQPEAGAVVSEAEVEVLCESKPDLEGSNEIELNQQDLIEFETDQQDHDQQTQQQVSEADSGVGGGELSASEANQEESLAVSAMSEAGLVDGSVPSASEGEPPAIVEEGAVDEKLDESQECTIQQESTNGDDVLDQEMAPSGEVIEVPSGESEITEQSLNTTLPPDSEMSINEFEPMGGVIFEKGRDDDSPGGDVERDIGEEEATLSTVAEAGSVVNDFDENASYQQLPTDFPSSEQDAEISESRESKDTISSRPTELIVVGLTEQTDGEGREFDDYSSPRASELIEAGSTKLVGGEHADSFGDENKVSVAPVGYSLKDEVEWKAVQDSGPHEEPSSECMKAENPATTLLESYIEVPVDVRLSEESNAPDKEVNFVVEGGDGDENVRGMAPPTFGIATALESLAVSEEELMPKILPSVIDGLRTLPSSESTAHDLFTPGERTVNLDNTAVNTVEPEIYTLEAKDSNAVAYTPSGEVLMNASNGAPPRSASPRQDIEDVQAFRQQKTQEASLPVVVPTKDVQQRALNLKDNEHPSRGGTLQRRMDWLGCCGMFDLLLGKNK